MEPKQISCVRFIVQNLESNTQLICTTDIQHYYYECRINELHGREIRACFHGWVILSDHLDSSVLWFLWNPLTSKLINLPPLNLEEKDFYQCCLSSSPDDQSSVFMLFSNTNPTIVFCRMDRKRKRLKWTKMSYARQIQSISGLDNCFLYSPTCCNGKVYAMSWNPCMFIIQVDIVVKGKQVVITLLPFVEIPFFSCICPFNNSFEHIRAVLKGSCTELFFIAVGYNDEATKMIVDVCVFKLDMTSMMWKELIDLEDAIFFLDISDDYSTCYYSCAVDSKLGGYIHIIGESGKIIYSFYAKDRSVSLSSLSCLLEGQAYTWAMLEWRLEVDHAKSKQEEEDKDFKIVVNGDKTEFDNTTGESHLLNMPLHILRLIMERTIGVEYIRFRATCKDISLAAYPIKWSNKTTLRRLQKYSLVSPWLMVLDYGRNTMTFIDPICGDKYFMKTPQELNDGYDICCSKYGWLLMLRIEDGTRLVFFNPFTSNIIELPMVPPYLESFCFSEPPSSPDCIVVGFTRCGPLNVYIHFVSSESTWRTYGLNFGNTGPYSFHFPTFSGRDIYAWCNKETIESLKDVNADDGYSWEVVGKAPISRCGGSMSQYFLTICDQHLLLVIVGEIGESVEVFKLNESRKEWEKLDALGKHMIYISDTSCICLEATLPVMENKIYFPIFIHGEDTKMVYYSLETCRYHTFDHKNIQESFGANLLTSTYSCHPHTWIEPSWS